MDQRFLQRLLEWFWDSVERLVTLLKLDSSGSKALLAFDFGITLFLALSLIAFLAHDIIWFVLSWFSGMGGDYHSFPVFLVSVIVVVISFAGILLHEFEIMRRR